jgi:hypothetical protein
MYSKISELLPHLQELKDLLTPEMGREKYKSARLNLELLPYSFQATQYALWNCIQAHNTLIEKHIKLNNKNQNSPMRILNAEESNSIAFSVDSFFDASRRLQNSLLLYISRTYRISLSSSLSDVVNKLKTEPDLLEPVLCDTLVRYWDEYGLKLKNYRDLIQHHALILSDARIISNDSGQVGLYILLPNNPENKKAIELQFGAPRIHAMEYIQIQFKEIYRLVFFITYYLLDKLPKKINPSGTKSGRMFGPNLREPLILGGEAVEAVPSIPHSNMKNEIKVIFENVKNLCLNYFSSKTEDEKPDDDSNENEEVE